MQIYWQVPRFTTDFSLRDLSRNLQQPSVSDQTKSVTCDSDLNSELEDILAQLDQLFPSDDKTAHPMENITLVKGANQVAGVMAEFVDCFKE